MVHKATDNMKLPDAILGIVELNRALHELDLFNDQITQQVIRYHDKTDVSIPIMGYSLNALISLNNLDIKDSQVRSELKYFLEDIKMHAPVIYLGFAQEVMSDELESIIRWMRSELHPNILVHVGLQPEIIGGCTIRTVNHYYDFSLRQYFNNTRSMLLTGIKAL
jgi:F0F1-type ATP synthase delta subunit